MAKLSLGYRLHEWLADHITGIQYPRQVLQPTQQRRPFFRHAMPIWQRIFLLQFGILITLVGLALSALGLFVAYIFVRALFSLS